MRSPDLGAYCEIAALLRAAARRSSAASCAHQFTSSRCWRAFSVRSCSAFSCARRSRSAFSAFSLSRPCPLSRAPPVPSPCALSLLLVRGRARLSRWLPYARRPRAPRQPVFLPRHASSRPPAPPVLPGLVRRAPVVVVVPAAVPLPGRARPPVPAAVPSVDCSASPVTTRASMPMDSTGFGPCAIQYHRPNIPPSTARCSRIDITHDRCPPPQRRVFTAAAAAAVADR